MSADRHHSRDRCGSEESNSSGEASHLIQNPMISNLLESIGFDFEMSKQMQERAKDRQAIVKPVKPPKLKPDEQQFGINQTASFLASDTIDELGFLTKTKHSSKTGKAIVKDMKKVLHKTRRRSFSQKSNVLQNINPTTDSEPVSSQTSYQSQLTSQEGIFDPQMAGGQVYFSQPSHMVPAAYSVYQRYDKNTPHTSHYDPENPGSDESSGASEKFLDEPKQSLMASNVESMTYKYGVKRKRGRRLSSQRSHSRSMSSDRSPSELHLKRHRNCSPRRSHSRSLSSHSRSPRTSPRRLHLEDARYSPKIDRKRQRSFSPRRSRSRSRSFERLHMHDLSPKRARIQDMTDIRKPRRYVSSDRMSSDEDSVDSDLRRRRGDFYIREERKFEVTQSVIIHRSRRSRSPLPKHRQRCASPKINRSPSERNKGMQENLRQKVDSSDSEAREDTVKHSDVLREQSLERHNKEQMHNQGCLDLLNRELETLKKQERELLRIKPRHKGKKDPLLVENSKLQSEISEQIVFFQKSLKTCSMKVDTPETSQKGSDKHAKSAKKISSELDYSDKRVSMRQCHSSERDRGSKDTKRSESAKTDVRRGSGGTVRKYHSADRQKKYTEKQAERSTAKAATKTNVSIDGAVNHWCRLCNCALTTNSDVQQHLDSAEHKQREQQEKWQPPGALYDQTTPQPQQQSSTGVYPSEQLTPEAFAQPPYNPASQQEWQTPIDVHPPVSVCPPQPSPNVYSYQAYGPAPQQQWQVPVSVYPTGLQQSSLVSVFPPPHVATAQPQWPPPVVMVPQQQYGVATVATFPQAYQTPPIRQEQHIFAHYGGLQQAQQQNMTVSAEVRHLPQTRNIPVTISNQQNQNLRVLTGATKLKGSSASTRHGSMAITTISTSPDSVMTRSKLLDNFLKMKVPKIALLSLTNHVVEFSKTDRGAQYISDTLSSDSVAEITMIFKEILASGSNMILHPFGHRVVNKLFQICSPKKKKALGQCLRGLVLKLTPLKYGCEVLAHVLRACQDLQDELVKELDGRVVEFATTEYGSLLLITFIQCAGVAPREFIIRALKIQEGNLFKNEFGSLVIHSILDHSTTEQRAAILAKLRLHIEINLSHYIGNRLYEYILDHGTTKEKSNLIKAVSMKMLTLSCQNIISRKTILKCISCASPSDRFMLIDAVFSMNFEWLTGDLYQMMINVNCHGILLKLIDIAEPSHCERFRRKLKPYFVTFPQRVKLNAYKMAQKIMAKLEEAAGKSSSTNPEPGTTPCDASTMLLTGTSALLQSVHEMRPQTLLLTDLTNHFVEFAMDKLGSQYIRNRLNGTSSEEIELVFKEILPAARSLVLNESGSYVIEMLFEIASSGQKQKLAKCVQGHVLELALQQTGLRIIEHALESCQPDTQVKLVKELDGHVMDYANDAKRSVVLQKVIQFFKPEHLQFIIDAFTGQECDVFRNENVCRLIQLLLDHCTTEQKALMLAKLHEYIDSLLPHHIGNRLYDHILEHGTAQEKSNLIKAVSMKILAFNSQNLISRNILLKCISCASPSDRSMLVDTVFSVDFEVLSSDLFQMMVHTNSYPVMLKLINIAEPLQCEVLRGKFQDHFSKLPESVKQSTGMTAKMILNKLAQGANKPKPSETSTKSLLQYFHATRPPTLQLTDLVNHFVEFSMDKLGGSQYIVSKLNSASSDEIELVFKEILPAARSLMLDYSGSQVIELIFQKASAAQKQKLTQCMQGHVAELALQKTGSKIIEHLLESCQPDDQFNLLKELEGQIVKCAKNSNGSVVLVKIIQLFQPEHLQFIIDAFTGQEYLLFNHVRCSRVMMSMIEHCSAEQIAPLLDKLHERILRIITSRPGNEVVKHVLEHGTTEDKCKIMKVVYDNVLEYCQNDRASCLVLKCLADGTPNYCAMLIDKVCPVTMDGATLYQMMRRLPASVVLEKIIEVAEAQQLKVLFEKIDNFMNSRSGLNRPPLYMKLINALEATGLQNSQAEKNTLLEDFIRKNSSVKDLQIKGLVNHIIEFSKDRLGSQFILEKLQSATVDEREMVIAEIVPSAKSIMMNQYGNCVVQHLFEIVSSEQKHKLCQSMHGDVVALALDQYGSAVIQKAISHCSPVTQVELVKELDGQVMICAIGHYGHRVLKTIIECLKPEQMQFVIDGVNSQSYYIMTQQYGSNLIECILQHCTKKQTASVTAHFHEHIDDKFIEDQSGSKVVLQMIEHGDAETKSKITKAIHGKMLIFSLGKFASNVVEKCLDCSSPSEHAPLIDEVCAMDADGQESPLYQMVTGNCSNFVMMKIIESAEPSQYKILLDKIQPHIKSLSACMTAWNIVAKLTAAPSSDKPGNASPGTTRKATAVSKNSPKAKSIVQSKGVVSQASPAKRKIEEVDIFTAGPTAKLKLQDDTVKTSKASQAKLQKESPSKTEIASKRTTRSKMHTSLANAKTPDKTVLKAVAVTKSKTQNEVVSAAAPAVKAKIQDKAGSKTVPTTKPKTQAEDGSKSTQSTSKVTPLVSRSEMLQKFRNNQLPNLQLFDVQHAYVEFSQDEIGVQFIVDKLNTANLEEKAAFFTKNLVTIKRLLIDKFGNCVIKKLFEVGSFEQKEQLLNCMRGNFISLGALNHGSELIECAIKSASVPTQVKLVADLHPHVLKCANDEKGSKVLQIFVKCLEPEQREALIDGLKEKAKVEHSLCIHPYGCHVIVSILEHCNTKQTASIFDTVCKHIDQFIQHPSANIVVQCAFQRGHAKVRAVILDKIRGKLMVLSLKKATSAVVESCIMHSSTNERAMLIDALSAMDAQGTKSDLHTMLNDVQANSVMQKIVEAAEPSQCAFLLVKSQPHAVTICAKNTLNYVIDKLAKAGLSTIAPISISDSVRSVKDSSAAPNTKTEITDEGKPTLANVSQSKDTNLLKSFLAKKLPNLRLRHLNNHVVEFTEDNVGSKFVLEKLKSATVLEKNMLFSEILPVAKRLMITNSGSHVVQNLIEILDVNQQRELAQSILSHVSELSLDAYGSAALQKIIRCCPSEIQDTLLRKLDVLTCAKHQIGYCLLLKIIECVKAEQQQIIIDTLQLEGQAFLLFLHPYGHHVITCILKHCNAEKTAPIIAKIHKHIDSLVIQQWSRKVVEHVLEHGSGDDKSKIIAAVHSNIFRLGQHQFASDVVVKCLIQSSQSERAMMIDKICSDEHVFILLKNPSGNNVLQKVVKMAEPSQLKNLKQRIQPHRTYLSTIQKGQEILAKLDQSVMETSPDSEAKDTVRSVVSRSAAKVKAQEGSSRCLGVTDGVKLLDNLRNGNAQNLQLKDVLNDILEFSRDELGSQFLQEKLDIASLEEKDVVFKAISPAAADLMGDWFGSDVIAKFFEIGSLEQKEILVRCIQGHVVKMAVHIYSSKVLTKALQFLPEALQGELAKELNGHLFKCAKNQYGKIVLQHAIKCVNAKYLQFIIDKLKGKVSILCDDTCGTHVIKCIVCHGTADLQAPFIEEIHRNLSQVLKRKHGKMICECVIKHASIEDRAKIFDEIAANMLLFSCQQFSSEFVQQCIWYSSPIEHAKLVNAVCAMDSDGPESSLHTMMTHSLANIVMDYLVMYGEASQLEALKQTLQPHVEVLQSSENAQIVLTILETVCTKTVSVDYAQEETMRHDLMDSEQNLPASPPASPPVSPPASPPVSAKVLDASESKAMKPSKSTNVVDAVVVKRPMLTDFENKKIQNLQLFDMLDQVVELSKSHNSLKFVVDKLSSASPDEIEMFFAHILPSANQLLCHKFGNHVIQKLFKIGTFEQKESLAKALQGHVCKLVVNKYGCAVIMKAILYCTSEIQDQIIREIDALKCVDTEYGSRLLQSMINFVKPDQRQIIIDGLLGQAYILFTHPHGYRVITRLLEHCSVEQTAPILSIVHQHIDELLQNQVGCKFLQFVLEHGRNEDRTKIFSEVHGRVLELSHKRSDGSVLVEKCIFHSSPKERALLIDEICSMSADGEESALYKMMRNMFTSVVMLQILDFADPSQLTILMNKLKPHFDTLYMIANSKSILGKLKRKFKASCQGTESVTAAEASAEIEASPGVAVHKTTLLETLVKEKEIPNLQLFDISGDVVEFSTHRIGSQFILDKLKAASLDEREIIVNEILPSTKRIVRNHFGNQVVQCLFETGSSEQKEKLAKSILGDIVALAFNQYGSIVIQKAIAHCSPEIQVEIVKELNADVLKCMKDRNSNNVLQKVIQCVKHEHLLVISHTIKEQVYQLFTVQHWFQLTLCILEHFTTEQISPILARLHELIDQILAQFSGKISLEKLLEKGSTKVKSMIVNAVAGRLLVLSQIKLGSYFVVKCLTHSSSSDRAMLINEVCYMDVDGPESAMYKMMKSQFATIVMQKVIALGETPQLQLLFEKLEPHTKKLNGYLTARLNMFKLKEALKAAGISVKDSSPTPQPNAKPISTAETQAGSNSVEDSSATAHPDANLISRAKTKDGPKSKTVVQPSGQNQPALKGKASKPQSTNSTKPSTAGSALLADFKSGKIPNLQFKDMVSHMVDFAKEKHCSHIFNGLDGANIDEKAMVFKEILPAANYLMMHESGSCVIKMFFGIGTPKQLEKLALVIQKNAPALSVHKYGCTVIQKAITCCSPEIQNDIVKELDVERCSRDHIGCSLLLTVAENLEPSQLQVIIDALKGKEDVLFTHTLGFQLIDSLLEHCTAEQTVPILGRLQEIIYDLVTTSTGSKVVQGMLENGSSEIKAEIINAVHGNVLALSLSKFGSWFMEKCIDLSSSCECSMLIDEMCALNANGPENDFVNMFVNRYATYVIQKMIAVAERAQLHVLMKKAQRNSTIIEPCKIARVTRAILRQKYISLGGKLKDISPEPEDREQDVASQSQSLLGLTWPPDRTLLQDFRSGTISNLQLKDIMDNVIEFTEDVIGSQFICDTLETASFEDKSMVIREILPNTMFMSMHKYGNSVIQKLFEIGSFKQKKSLAQCMRGHMRALSLHKFGSPTLQKAIQFSPPDLQLDLVMELDGHVLDCAEDPIGSCLLQKVVECINPEHLQFIFDAFEGQEYTLFTHQYCCRLTEHILEYCTPEQTEPLIDMLHSHIDQLIEHPYGSRVVLHVMEFGSIDDKTMIFREICGNMLALSQDEFASDVVEKCLIYSAPHERALLIDEVCSMNADGPHSALYRMVKNDYANKVMKIVIEGAEPEQCEILIGKVQPFTDTY